MVTKVTRFVADDGKEFEYEDDAQEYERITAREHQKRRDHYMTVSYSGKRLMEQHQLDETGLWEVRGEDDNPDIGGSHYTPLLGRVRGTLSEVIDWAVDQKRWSTWGGGGEIKRIDQGIIVL